MAATDDPVQEWIDAGLFDPTTDTDGQRRELLEWFEELGYSPTTFAGAEPDDLPAVGNRRLSRPGPMLSRDQAREQSGMSPELFERVARASGWPDHLEFTDRDVEALHSFRAASDLFSTDELLHFVRVLNATMGRLAEAATALFRIDVGSNIEARGGREVDWAKSNYAASQLMAPIGAAMEAFLLIQLEESSRRGDAGRERVSDSGNSSTLQLAVGFVDLVGYTQLTEQLEPDDLGAFIQTFEARAYELVAANSGRVVKLIGDEVMFVTVDPNNACRIAKQIIESFEGEATTPSGGVAYGEVIARGGDFYGRVVNLAARMADLAVPSEVLVDEVTAVAANHESFEPAGKRQLRGFEQPLSLRSLRFDDPQ